jgi:hypothetical protein
MPALRLVEASGFRPSMPTSLAPGEFGASCTKALVGDTLVAE